jgi:hypothetical protein
MEESNLGSCKTPSDLVEYAPFVEGLRTYQTSKLGVARQLSRSSDGSPNFRPNSLVRIS